jgi:hypothetical protein
MALFPPVASPAQALTALSGQKSFLQNPILGDPDLNARGLHRWRVETAARLAERRRRRLAGRIAPADAAALDRDGFVMKTDYLDPETFAAVQAAVFGHVREAREMRQGQTVTRMTPLGGRGLAPMRAVARRKELSGLMAYAAGRSGAPTFFLQTVIAEPSVQDADPQTALHADTFHPTAKLWLFLTDVGEDDGPFVFVPGAHRLTPERLEWEYRQSLGARNDPRLHHALGSFRIEPSELAALGYGAPRRMTVRANTLIVANTYAFHNRAPSPKPTVRVELHGGLRRNPFMPWNGLDPAALAGPWQLDAFYLWLAARKRLTGEDRTIWKPSGRVAVDAPPVI